VVDTMRACVASATIRTNYGVLRAVLSAAVDAELIARSPCRAIRLENTRRGEPRHISAEELHELADSMPVEFRAMVYVAGALGLRWSEVAGLRVRRVDFLRRSLTVAETLTDVGRTGPLTGSPNPGHSARRTCRTEPSRSAPPR
jgi:integrase